MENIERIINSEENLPEIKKILIDNFKEDYGSKNIGLVKQKINNGIYFFESTPDITLSFLLQHKPSILNDETIQIEYADYINKQQEIARSLTDEVFQLYAVAFNLSKEEIVKLIYKKELLIKLPIEAYYEEAIKSKNSDIKREYLKQCEELGIKPLVDSNVIERLLIAKTKREKNSNIKMITDTIWGRRISEKFNKKIGEKVSPEIVADVIYGPPCNVEIPTNYLIKKKMLYFPLIRQSIIGDTDTAFLHEARHMVEYGKFCSGIDWINGNYMVLNELRVEKHAIKDNEKTEVIFSKRPLQEDIYLPYRILFPLAEDFIEEYESTLDQLSVNQNITELESIFGHRDIKEYGMFLNQVFNKVINMPDIEKYECSKEEKTKSKEYIKKIKDNVKNSR